MGLGTCTSNSLCYFKPLNKCIEKLTFCPFPSLAFPQEIATCDPSFYKHTQKIFLLLHQHGLAYRTEAEVNYDPVDKTVLANEQVDANGCSWRSGAKVEKRKLNQWFLRISAFREALLDDLELLAKDEAWPERVLAMQRNWLGKSKGATIKFPILAYDQDVHAAIEVYTSRPDTLFGVQYLALAATHPIVTKLAETDPELQAFLDTLPGLPPDSKVGYMLPHIRAINPLAYHPDTPDATKQSLPIYVAPYVIGDYGEGAVMGVPAHDARDHAFWRTHRGDEPVRYVLASNEDESTTVIPNEPFLDHGIMTAHSGPYKGKPSQEAGEMLVKMLAEAGLAKPVEKWRLRDWLISRQRYWGTPIPIVHCASCGEVPVPDEQLPVLLPEVDAHWAGKKTGNPLETLDEWVNTECPKCHGPAKRDTDTMDTFVDSSWYYMRFIDPHNEAGPFDPQKARDMLPVDIYIGGIEHAILHLLYARFIYKFLMTSPLFPTSSASERHEPFKRLITQGMVHGRTFTDPATGRFLKPDELDLSDPANPRIKATGTKPNVTYEKMSKSKHNGVDPTAVIATHGADATRAHMLFQAPVGDVLDWDGDKIVGVTRWLSRVHDLVEKVTSTAPSPDYDFPTPKAYFESLAPRLSSLGEAELKQYDANSALWRTTQTTIASVSQSYEKVYPLNTVISDLMQLTNTLSDTLSCATPQIAREAVSILIRLMAPVTPAVAEECWSVLEPTSSGLFASEEGARWPERDGSEAVLRERKMKCAVQVNGKVRAVCEIGVAPEGLEGDKLREFVVGEIMKQDEHRQRLEEWLGKGGEKAKKVVVVKGGRVVNFVV